LLIAPSALRYTRAIEWLEPSEADFIAELIATLQPITATDKIAVNDDGLAFSPWHGIDAHRPLGGAPRALIPRTCLVRVTPAAPGADLDTKWYR